MSPARRRFRFCQAARSALIVSTPFAISLYWVMYAYSGWNASTYIVGEVRDPARTIPLSLGLGTLLVTVLYLGINAVFLRTTPAAEMIGKQEVGLIAGVHIFGEAGGKVMAVFIALGLISAVSAMMWIGPRVTVAMGEDLRALSWLARRNARGIPIRATLVQFAIVEFLHPVHQLPKGGQLRAVQSDAFFQPDRFGRDRVALAATRFAAALSDLGLPVYAADISRSERVDALAFAGRRVDSRSVALGLGNSSLGFGGLFHVAQERV